VGLRNCAEIQTKRGIQLAFTYFFRDLQTLELVAEHVVPYTMGRSHIRVWDAGCAMGQEAYSLAMLLAEKMGGFSFKNLRIHATDLDDSNLFGKIICSGSYKEEEVKRMPPAMRGKYFRPDDKPGSLRIVENLRRQVLYQKHNLLTLKPIGQSFSLIVCKNVLLHFQPAQRLDVLRMFHGSLAPGGYFATEQTQKMPAEVACLFEQVSGCAQVFRKVEVQ
jgi:chemotaxis protein methyltransferase CheR